LLFSFIGSRSGNGVDGGTAVGGTASGAIFGGSGGAGGSGSGIRSPNDSGHLPSPVNRSLTVSNSGRGAPSVTMSSFRQANQSIKRVPQSARSRVPSAPSRARSATARNDAANTHDWDQESEGEFEELEDFNNEDIESLRAANSGVSQQDDSPVSVTGSSRTPSRATSSAAAAYAAGSKAMPKSILKSSKRVRSAATCLGFPPDTGQPPVTSADSCTSRSTYSAAAPPGFTSTSRISLVGAPPAPAVGGPAVADSSSGGGGSECTIGLAQGNGGVGGYGGGSCTGLARPGVSSLKLTADELLGLLMAQGKLTEHDVQELGLTPGTEPRGSPGGGGSTGSGSPVAPSQSSGIAPTAAVAQVVLGGVGAGSGTNCFVRSPGLSSDTAIPPVLTTLRGSDTGSAAQQRVRFGVPQVVRASSVSNPEVCLREPREAGSPPQSLSNASHRVRFGGEEPVCEVQSSRAFGGTALVLPTANNAAAAAGSPGAAAGAMVGNAESLDVLLAAAVVTEGENTRRVGLSVLGCQQQQHQQLPQLPQQQQQQQQHLQLLLQTDHRNAFLEGFSDRERERGEGLPLPLTSLTPLQLPRQHAGPGGGGLVAATGAAMASSTAAGTGGGGGGATAPTAARRMASDLDSSLDLDEVLSSTARHLGDSHTSQQVATELSNGGGCGGAVDNNRRVSLAALPSLPSSVLGPLLPSVASAGSGAPLPAASLAQTASAPVQNNAPPLRPEILALRLSPPDVALGRGSGGGDGGSGSYRSSDSGITRLSAVQPRHSTRHSCNGDAGSFIPAATAAASVAAAAASTRVMTPPSPGTGAHLHPFRLAATSGLASRPGSAGSTTSVTAFGSWAPPPQGMALLPPPPTGSGALASEVTSGQCSSASISDSGFAPGGGGGGSGSAGGGGGVRGVGTIWASGSAGPPHTVASKKPISPRGEETAAWPAPKPGMGAVDFLALRKLQSHLKRSGKARASTSGVETQRLLRIPTPQPGSSRATWCDGAVRGDSGESFDNEDCGQEARLAPGPGGGGGGGGGGGRSVRFTAPVVFEVEAEADDSDDDRDGGEDEATAEAEPGWGGHVAGAAEGTGRHRSRAPTARGGERLGVATAGGWL
ncbi:hypothetical protein Vretifemale_5918, partial [Volvox reticuliferus]